MVSRVASINAVVHGPEGWSLNAAVVAIAGVGLTFATWWMYFAIPWAEVLVLHRAEQQVADAGVVEDLLHDDLPGHHEADGDREP